MRCSLLFSFSLLLTVLLAPAPAQSPGEHVWHADALDAAAVRRYRDNMTSVLGRVMETREVGEMTFLILDGGALHISTITDKSVKWEGRLIESTGVIEATPPAKPGAPVLPPFRMIQLSKKGIRIITETPESGRSVLIQRSQPGQAETSSRPDPPGTKPGEAQLAPLKLSYHQKQLWARKNGQKVTVAFDGWRYRQRTAADRKSTEWVVEMYARNGNNSDTTYYFPEDLDLSPLEEERLRLSLWKEVIEYAAIRAASAKSSPDAPAANKLFFQPLGMPSPEQELTETAEWEEKLKTWGEAPLRQESEKIRRLPGPEDFGNVPDLRQPTVVKLLKPSAKGRTEGTLVLLDWAMTGEPASTKVVAKVRWSDGMEDTVPALRLAPDMILKTRNSRGEFSKFTCSLIFLHDWVLAKQRKETLPGAELKIRAMRQFLRVWWNAPGVMPDAELPAVLAKKAETEAALAESKNRAEAQKQFRRGVRLPFPGLPPDGFIPVDKLDPDRSLMMPLPSDKPSFLDESNARAIAAVLTWWDASGVLPLPDKNGLKRSQDALLNYLKRNGSGLQVLAEYATKLLEDKYLFQVTSDQDFSPGNLSRFTNGLHAVILPVRVQDNNRVNFNQDLAVISVTPQGVITFCAWGRKVEGLMKVTDLHEKSKRPSSAPKLQQNCYEIEITSPSDVQEMLKKKGLRVVLDDWRETFFAVITPYSRDPAAAPPAGAKKP